MIHIGDVADVAYLGAQAALDALILIDLVLQAYIADRLSGTFHGAIVARDAVVSILYIPFTSS